MEYDQSFTPWTQLSGNLYTVTDDWWLRTPDVTEALDEEDFTRPDEDRWTQDAWPSGPRLIIPDYLTGTIRLDSDGFHLSFDREDPDDFPTEDTKAMDDFFDALAASTEEVKENL